MASKKKKSTEALAPQIDPKAPLDGAAFLSAAQKTLKALAEDLLARADGSASITEGLKARWAVEQEKRRTGDAYEPWRRRFVVQVGVAWILGCVFARTLEDRGLVDRNRVAGPGAADSVRQFLDMAPHLTEREYLLTVFRELANLRAARDLFDARHNPVWKLAPSADGAKLLMDLFRGPDAEAPAFRFGQSDTRFLGDLYQDLSDEVRERFALLQTPRFVESFILDQTLEPAIAEFGLDQATIIDPTCGSGHFLLGAFERLVDHRLRAQPGLDVREAAVKALDAVHGADINPYAAAIARFRLVLAFLERGSYTRIEDAPELPIHVVVGDSLLHGRGSTGQEDFAHVAGTDASKWKDDLFALEDETEAKRVLRKRYAAVVGNPPYITVKDAVLREEYRKLYVSAAGKYSLAAPFAECFFDLAREGGFVGTITANSFMKREFGKKLIEEFLKSRDLQLVVNTSGAYIPGHGTPTVLLFGRSQAPVGAEIRAVLAKRGEPSTPDDPARGLVWRSIVEHLDEPGFDNEFISTARVPRSTIAKHPWSLGGGGAAELKELLEERAPARLGDLARDIGFDAIMGEDEIFAGPAGWLERLGTRPEHARELAVGEGLRDWSLVCAESVLFPYDATLTPTLPEYSTLLRDHFWRYRVPLTNRRQFGKTTVEAGLAWFEYRSFYKSKRFSPLSIAFAFVATHNHFVLDRGGKVFKQSAPIIKLPPEATEDDHLALLAYLNSSTACFWMKQVFHDKGSGTGSRQPDPAKARFEFAGTGLADLPVPRMDANAKADLASLAAELMTAAAQRGECVQQPLRSDEDPSTAFQRAAREDAALLERCISLQEDVDWKVYALFGLIQSVACKRERGGVALGHRPFERRLALSGVEVGIDGQPLDARPSDAADAERVHATGDELLLLEAAAFKRRWVNTPKHLAGAAERFEHRLLPVLSGAAQDAVEHVVKAWSIPGTARLAEQGSETLQLERINALAACAGAAATFTVEQVLRESAVPFLAALRFSEAGLEKYQGWLRVWDSQRDEDLGILRQPVPLPDKYGADDFLDAQTELHRGKLDVPKERFISYPGCESDEDKSPVYGWAGWDHLQRAQALSALYQKRKNEEAWGKDRLTPMLVGLQELVPWLKQWHNDPDPNFGGERLGNFFADFVASECQTLGLTLDDLKNWRPPAKSRGAAKKKTATKADAPDASLSATDDGSPPSTPKKKRAKKRATSADEGSSEIVPSPDAIAFAKRNGFLAE